MSETDNGAPRSFLVFALVVLVCAVALLFVSWFLWPVAWSLQLLLVLFGAALSEVFSLSFPTFNMSLAYPLGISAIALFGPAGAGLVAAFSSGAVPDVIRRRPAIVVAFNFGQLVLLACVGGWTYVSLGGPVLQQGPWTFRAFDVSDFPRAIYAMIGTALLVSGVNLVLTATGISLYKRVPFGSVFASAFPLQPSQIALAFVGFMMAQVLAVNVIALPLFVFPLFVARQLYQRYTTLREAYVDTVRSLIGALEAKDPYTRGHSERVAEYVGVLGRRMGLERRALERLEYAALLHDLGKLRVARSILIKPGSLTHSELMTIQEHPQVGAEMIARIPPLKDLAECVRLHHERWDGSGYPSGLSGEMIPLSARLLSVADSYDAMTTSRSYRPAMSHEAAQAELIRCAGLQFDAAVVREFVEARVGLSIASQAQLSVRTPAESDGLTCGGET